MNVPQAVSRVEEAKEQEEAAAGTELYDEAALVRSDSVTDPQTSFFGKIKRFFATKLFRTIPVDAASMVYYGIRELRIGQVLLEAVPYGDGWTLHDSLRVTWIDLEGNQEVDFLAGMDTDLASIPRLLWRVIPPHRSIKRPAVFHDALYHNRPFLLAADGKMKRVDRGKADKLLYVAMRAEKIAKETANEVYVGVRIGGSKAWHAHDEYFARVDAAAILVREAAAAAAAAEAENVAGSASDQVDPVSATGDPDAAASDIHPSSERLCKDGSDTPPA